MRIDIYLHTNNFFASRSKAVSMIKDGYVFVNGKVVLKPSFLVTDNDAIEITKKDFDFVSRGGFKLLKALEVFNIDVNNKIALDIGASTGGFTDCLLQNGAKKVYAVDVGQSQLVDEIKFNPKVTSFENTNFRYVTKDMFDSNINIVVIDVSFISIVHIFENLKNVVDNCVVIGLIKPQFETLKSNKGIVKNKQDHIKILDDIIRKTSDLGFVLTKLDYSPIKGGSGNIEYIGFFEVSGKQVDNIKDIVNNAFKGAK